MVFFAASILFTCVLPSVMGLTLDTPAATDADGTLLVTWKPVKGDPAFTLILDGAINVDIATGIKADAGNTSVGLGFVPPGSYKLQAVVADDIDTVLSTSGDFQILPAGTPPAGAPPASAPPPAVAPSSAAPPSAAPSPPATGATTGAGNTGKGGKAGKVVRNRVPLRLQPLPLLPLLPLPPPAAAAAAGAGKVARVVSAKFGQRELYRD
ncbi:hypothetical protein MVEN_00194400 [Mycena venus]|uniref:Uncharacterized protein n=1 Tax=Mycena venus TaxID=2733690 RepID=A0A8H7DE08_9AGAR|nr:hypothetical protein MVEN_00194400 [Mycena venus]